MPAKRAKTLDPENVPALEADILENGQTTSIRILSDGERNVLIDGLHRLEALPALGEPTVQAYQVRAQLH